MKKPATPASLRDLCLTHFKILGIPIAPNDLDTMLERADKETLSHLMFLDLLLGQQAAARRARSVEYRIRRILHAGPQPVGPTAEDPKSTRLNSSHLVISYAGFCL